MSSGGKQQGSEAQPGRAAFVTGVASGIGRAVGLRLLELGWRVGGVDIDPKGASWAATQDEGGRDQRWAFAVADVSDQHAVENAVAELRGKLRLRRTMRATTIASEVPLVYRKNRKLGEASRGNSGGSHGRSTSAYAAKTGNS